MDVRLVPGAVEDREELNKFQWKTIKSKIREVTGSMSHKDLKLVPNPFLEHPVWQLSIDEEGLNHRVYIDVNNGDMIILAIWDFEFTH